MNGRCEEGALPDDRAASLLKALSELQKKSLHGDALMASREEMIF